MRYLRVVLATLLAALLVSTQTAWGQAGEDTIDVTFRLTLHGDVPATDTFYLTAFTCTPGHVCTGSAATVVFCGTGKDPYFPTPGPCEGGGHTYAETFPVPSGDSLSYSLRRRQVGKEHEQGLSRGNLIVNRAHTISASYRYPESKDRQGRRATPEQMPRVGGGGTANQRLPLETIAWVITLTAAGGLSVVTAHRKALARRRIIPVRERCHE
ncbi:MAG: hypothetical protein M3P51_13905 [Chloroflexota bacterium]|nr:hypothetical protein [Chloroflexota bacterium]